MPMRDVVVFTAVTALVTAVVSTALRRKNAAQFGHGLTRCASVSQYLPTSVPVR